MIDMCSAIASKRKYFGCSLRLCARLLFLAREPKTKLKRDAETQIALSDGCLNVFTDFQSKELETLVSTRLLHLIGHRGICKKFLSCRGKSRRTFLFSCARREVSPLVKVEHSASDVWIIGSRKFVMRWVFQQTKHKRRWSISAMR